MRSQPPQLLAVTGSLAWPAQRWAAGMPAITQPGVYFGANESGYVVANTKQSEVDYQQSGNPENHYK